MKDIEAISAALRMSMDLTLSFRWISLLVLAPCLVLVIRLALRKETPHPAIVILFSSAIFWTFLFAWMAVTFEYDRQSPSAIEDSLIPTYALNVLACMALVQMILCIVLAKQQRFLAGSIAACATWFGIWIHFVAGMSISGVWL